MVGVFVRCETHRLGVLRSIYVCAVPCVPVVVTRLEYDPTEVAVNA